MDQRNGKLRKDLDKHVKEIDKKQQEMKKLEADRKKLQQQFRKAEKEKQTSLQDLTSKGLNIEQRMIYAEREAQSSLKEIQRIKERLECPGKSSPREDPERNERERERQQDRQLLMDLQNRMDTMQQDLDRVKNEKDSLRQENEDLRTQLESLNEKLASNPPLVKINGDGPRSRPGYTPANPRAGVDRSSPMPSKSSSGGLQSSIETPLPSVPLEIDPLNTPSAAEEVWDTPATMKWNGNELVRLQEGKMEELCIDSCPSLSQAASCTGLETPSGLCTSPTVIRAYSDAMLAASPMVPPLGFPPHRSTSCERTLESDSATSSICTNGEYPAPTWKKEIGASSSSASSGCAALRKEGTSPVMPLPETPPGNPSQVSSPHEDMSVRRSVSQASIRQTMQNALGESAWPATNDGIKHSPKVFSRVASILQESSPSTEGAEPRGRARMEVSSHEVTTCAAPSGSFLPGRSPASPGQKGRSGMSPAPSQTLRSGLSTSSSQAVLSGLSPPPVPRFRSGVRTTPHPCGPPLGYLGPSLTPTQPSFGSFGPRVGPPMRPVRGRGRGYR